MDIWEAKYNALLMDIKDQKSINNAEKLVRAAMDLSQSTQYSLAGCFGLLQDAIFCEQRAKSIEAIKALTPKKKWWQFWK